jgi:hypothetical protein
MTEDMAEEVIAYAEEAAERVEEEQRLAKQAEDEARARGELPAAPARASGPPRAADILPGGDEAPRAEPARPTFESIFGPEPPAPVEESLSAAQVFGEAPPAGAAEKPTEEERKE